jgi:alpha-1,2-glucosyltransferase
VFWVVVFNGGLEAVDAVKTIKAPRPEVRDARDSLAGRLWLVLGQYAAGHVHDPLLCSAWGDDLV